MIHNPTTIKTVFEILAIIGTALIFFILFGGGSFWAVLSLKVQIKRQQSSNEKNKDILAVSINITNNGKMGVRIIDGLLNAYSNGSIIKSTHFEYLNRNPIDKNGKLCTDVLPSKQIGLGPGQTNTFSTSIIVNEDETYDLEVAFVAKNSWFNPGFSISKSTVISLPQKSPLAN